MDKTRNPKEVIDQMLAVIPAAKETETLRSALEFVARDTGLPDVWERLATAVAHLPNANTGWPLEARSIYEGKPSG